MPWRVAKSPEILLDQINELAPHRSKLSDGAIGDAHHASRASDHNPWVMDGKLGIVTARDFTHDPAGGFDAYKFAETLRTAKDQRIKYVISNRRIFSGAGQDKPAWAWRPYTGTNPHNHHTHVSVKADKAHYDATLPWVISGAIPAAQPPSLPASAPVMAMPTLKKGDASEAVRTAQRLLFDASQAINSIDGIFGEETRVAVLRFQKAHGLAQDGMIGAYTWVALKAPAPAAPADWFSSPFPALDDFGLAWGEAFEHFEALPYPDPDWTRVAQGFGHNASSGMPPIPAKGGAAWTEDYARQVYKADLAVFGRYLNYYVSVPLKQGHINALVLDIFKLGPTKWKADKVRELLNAGDYAGAFAALRARPTIIKGVARRYDILAKIGEGATPSPKTW